VLMVTVPGPSESAASEPWAREPGAGEPGPRALHHERLVPGPGGWLLLAGFCGSLALVFLPLLGPAATGVLAGGLSVLFGGLLLRATPTVSVAEGWFHAGRARIPLACLGGVEELSPEAMRRACGTDLDGQAYLCLRGWVHTGVRVQVRDRDDPTPYWVVATRRPRDLARALRAVDSSPEPPGATAPPEPSGVAGSPAASGTACSPAAEEHAERARDTAD